MPVIAKQDLINAKADADALSGFLNGGPSTAVSLRLGGSVPSLQAIIALIQAAAGNAGDFLMQLSSYAALRAYSGDLTFAILTNDGIAGMFFMDASDTTSLDDSAMVIVGADNRRWKRIHPEEPQATWFGAIGDESADDTDALQAAVEWAGESDKTIFFPSNRYKLTGNLAIDHQQFVMRGQGRAKSHLLAYAVDETTYCERMLRFTDDQKTYLEISGFQLEGRDVANNAVYALRIAHMLFKDLFIASFKAVESEAAIYIGGALTGDSACNVFEDLLFSYNYGHALRFAGVNNVNYIRATFLGNGYFGIIAEGSEVVYLTGTMELNKRGAVMCLAGVNNFSAETVYNLSNAEDGHTFSGTIVDGDAFTVRADYIFNGASVTAVSSAFPCRCVRLVNHSVHTAYPDQDCFVFAPGAEDLYVDQIQLNPDHPNYGEMPCVALFWGTQTNRSPKIRVGTVIGCDPHIAFLGWDAASPVLEFDAFNIRVDGIEAKNYAVMDMNTWTNVGGGASSTWDRAADGDNGESRWAINVGAASTSNIYGWQENAEDRPDRIDKYFEFSLDVEVSVGDGTLGGNVYCGLGVQSTVSDTTTNKQKKGGVFRWPASGLLTFGGLKHGSGSSGNVKFSNPVLCEVGADQAVIRGRIARNRTDFSGTDKPLTGTWKQGDKVWKSNPVTTGTPGYVCVTSNTSGGVWDAMPGGVSA